MIGPSHTKSRNGIKNIMKTERRIVSEPSVGTPKAVAGR